MNDIFFGFIYFMVFIGSLVGIAELIERHVNKEMKKRGVVVKDE